MAIYSTIVGFFQDGGWLFMGLIALVLVAGIIIALERYIYLSLAKSSNRRIWNQISPIMQSGNYRQAMSTVNKSNSAIAKILSYGLSRIGSVRRREDLEMAMEEGLMEAIPRLEKRTHYLATLANIATLLGLLGTIVGLIHAFDAVATANAAEKATMLSKSIAIAMNTTAFGLISGIPLLFIHSILQSKTTEIVDSLEMASVKFLNIIAEQSRKEATGK